MSLDEESLELGAGRREILGRCFPGEIQIWFKLDLRFPDVRTEKANKGKSLARFRDHRSKIEGA